MTDEEKEDFLITKYGTGIMALCLKHPKGIGLPKEAIGAGKLPGVNLSRPKRKETECPECNGTSACTANCTRWN